jgi:hypothetical protein
MPNTIIEDDFGLTGGLGNVSSVLTGLQGTNLNRIPNGANLEMQSSDVIQGLLNPPDMFPEVDRMSAELGAQRGVGGSASSFGVGLRMTDEEKLKRMALGEDFLTKAFGRQPTVGTEDITPFIVTPFQERELELKRQELELQKKIAADKARAEGLNQGPQYYGPLGFTPAGTNMFEPVSGLPTWMTGRY